MFSKNTIIPFKQSNRQNDVKKSAIRHQLYKVYNDTYIITKQRYIKEQPKTNIKLKKRNINKTISYVHGVDVIVN